MSSPKQELPTHTQVLTVQKARTAAGGKSVYPNDAVLETKPVPKLGKGYVLVKINAAGFNHRDVKLFNEMLKLYLASDKVTL